MLKMEWGDEVETGSICNTVIKIWKSQLPFVILKKKIKFYVQGRYNGSLQGSVPC